LVADPTSLAHATLAAGFDYYDLGLTVGNLALRVLSGTRPNEIPVTYVTEGQLHLNLDLAAQIGLEFPASLIEQADAILYGGVLFSK
jgi:putative ABC transport system substrate-binding protein